MPDGVLAHSLIVGGVPVPGTTGGVGALPPDEFDEDEFVPPSGLFEQLDKVKIQNIKIDI